MAVRTRGVINNFNAIKKKNPGMSDSVAMEKAMKLSSKETLSANAAEAKRKKKDTWVSKLKMAVTGEVAKSAHSPAGRKYLKRKGKKYPGIKGK